MAGYELGYLANSDWYQHTDSTGFVFYKNLTTGVETTTIPHGWEDAQE